VDFRILGPLEVVEDGHALALGGQKQRALLALLVLEANRLVSRERLIDALWEEEPTPTATKALQGYVSQLRKTLGKDRVVTQPAGYMLRLGPDELDLARFEVLVADGRPHDALALWRGEPLAEFQHLRFAQADIARLGELYLRCVEARMEADLAAGRHAEVAGELEALVRSQPLRERLRELLLLALYRSGRQGDALAAYQDARSVLVEQLGVEPGRSLRELHQAILRQDLALDLAQPDESGSVPSVFVGRARELEQLVAGLDQAVAGHGSLFLLVGEPGIGKSRLADEAVRVARARGMDVLVGRCWEVSGAPAYWPWVQSLRTYGNAVLPELASLLRGEPVAEESEGARFRLFDATAAFLTAAARDRPLLLFLDDLHAADEPSLLLLRFVARELGSARIMLLGACRDVDPAPDGALSAMLAEVAREPVTTRIDLRGLGEDDVLAYVEESATGFASPSLAAELYEETEGNPLFLSETVRLLELEGRIAIPHSLREVITRRLAHLGDDCNRVLVHAAVLGREFDHATLARMSGLSDDDLLERLDEAMQARVVSDVPGATDRSRFAHVLIRDTLYGGLTSARRIRLHRLALETLEAMHGDDAELAYHAIAGNDFAKGRESARRAGDRALALLAYEEAARLYDVALTATLDDSERCELLLARGEAEVRAGRAQAAKQTFVTAADIARRFGFAHALGRAAAGYGGLIVWARAGDDAALVPLLEEALDRLDAADVELRVRLLARLAGALRDEPTRDRRDALSAEAVALGRATGNPATLASALVGRAHAITAPDTIAEFEAIATELCEVAEAAGDRERAQAGHVLRVMAQHLRGEMEGAARDLEIASDIAEGLRQPVHLWEVQGIRAMLALAEGKLDEAEVLIEEALRVGKEALPDPAVAHHLLQRAALCELRGGLDELEPLLVTLADDQPARPVLACALAYVQARLGRPHRPLMRLFEVLPFDQEWLLGMAFLAEACSLSSDGDTAEGLYAALVSWEALTAVDQSEGCRGSVAYHLGLLASLLDRRDDAVRHFECALIANERLGFRPWLARTKEAYGRLLRVIGGDERTEGATPA
jgi:DNA-binding SARP family transcriptional activator/tetratricopeptide (TPR) repeat protein